MDQPNAQSMLEPSGTCAQICPDGDVVTYSAPQAESFSSGERHQEAPRRGLRLGRQRPAASGDGSRPQDQPGVPEI